ncbi:hypothetical protein DCAR_0102835 [Daucus carota subsp. sativus]|uniref:Protein TIFY n=1 Tax=Daucus carota subsp. sativus TaxID=79200 RepID=A0AAF0W8J9_DAUCS|nr:hypothetical protein DCAR_0102835 [Daucus carota subsp. sativus]
MPESDVMTPEESISKSILEKPLHQLTEDDISQLTREDCRRYLKDKGMRRPSWNKSQAIQQVISLKALLEPASDSDAATARKKLHIPRPQIVPNRVPRGTSADTEISVSADESVPCTQKVPEVNPDSSSDLQGGLVPAYNETVPPRTTGVASKQVEQLTIFYCGKVNVYDDVPFAKAQAIMQLAASPLQFPQETSLEGNTVFRSLPCHLQPASVKVGLDSSVTVLPNLRAVKMIDNCTAQVEESNIAREENNAEGTASRKESVRRYLEKKKDRFKSKRKVGGSSITGLDFCLNHHMGNQTPNEHSGRSGAFSPVPIRSPNMRNSSGSLESNMLKNANYPVVVDDKEHYVKLFR